ncbi:M23 family metallopeptidase [Arthrobacter pityocampae]|uniref:M23 family metallopeptidase n=1 Tax=Arthrobacter pityocampae TaxID=547334 RepID=UPI003736E604
MGAALLAVLLCSPSGSPSGAPSAAAAVVELPSAPVSYAPAPYVPEWSWPLGPVPQVLRPFEKPPQKWKRGHRGVDLAGAGVGGAGVGRSVRVLSPADGIVSFAGTVVDRGVLSIDHGDGRVSSFEPVSTDLSRGEHVAAGQVVATLAPLPDGTGRGHCAQPCLHWGVRRDGEYVDPLSFVTDRRPSVLLPLDDRRRGGR